MRIAFFGLPLAAWLLHRDGHEIVYAGLSRDSPGGRRLRRALSGPVVSKPDVTAPRTIDLVRSLAPERIVSWFWTTKLPPELTALAPKGAFGVHPSLLPRHRGPDPYFWAIDAGDEVTGVTAHLLAGEYDTGGVVAQRALAIEPEWNAWQLARALDRPSLALLRAIAGEPDLRAAPQDETRATLAPSLSDDELEIDWKWTSDRIVRRIRAAAPSPGAWSFFGDEPVAIILAAPARTFPRALVPGEAAVIEGVGVVRTGDGAVTLLRGRMDARTDAADSPPYELPPHEPPHEHELDARDLADLIESIAKRGLSPSIGG